MAAPAVAFDASAIGWHVARTIATDGSWTIEEIAERTAEWA
jgi:hypothetical protein